MCESYDGPGQRTCRRPISYERVFGGRVELDRHRKRHAISGGGARQPADEDYSTALTYTGNWVAEIGNYSGGSTHSTTAPGSALECSYVSALAHTLYLGTRALAGGGQVTVQVDGGTPTVIGLALAGEDVLMRLPLGQQTASAGHRVTITHFRTAGAPVYFDFLEIAVPTSALPTFTAMPKTAAATDWDTNHSLALAPERTAWLVKHLGFRGPTEPLCWSAAVL